MSNNKDMYGYNLLVGKRDALQANYNNYLNKVEECRYLLKRLRAARDIVTEQKRAFSALMNTDKQQANMSYGQKGKNCKKINKMYNEVFEDNSRCFKNIDYVLDALNDEITRVKKERDKALGIVGDLASSIRYLGNEIRNYFN